MTTCEELELAVKELLSLNETNGLFDIPDSTSQSMELTMIISRLRELTKKEDD